MNIDSEAIQTLPPPLSPGQWLNLPLRFTEEDAWSAFSVLSLKLFLVFLKMYMLGHSQMCTLRGGAGSELTWT